MCKSWGYPLKERHKLRSRRTPWPALLSQKHAFIACKISFVWLSAQKVLHSPSVSVSVSVSLVSCPASPSVSLSSSLDSTGVCLLERLGLLALGKPPVLSAFIWPAIESVS